MDLDHDGFPDLLSGAFGGRIHLFRGVGKGEFAAGEPLEDSAGKPIQIGRMPMVHAADWDADGDVDLLAGSSGGEVHLLRNEGSPQRYRFAKPERLTVDGDLVEVPEGRASPAVADWDQDGRLDLLLGAGDGSVQWYRNLGTPQEPKLAPPETLIASPEENAERGKPARICLSDWNEDGRLDLLLGDRGGAFEKQLSEEEEAWREAARKQQADLLEVWAAVFNQYRQALRAPKADGRQARKRHEQEVTALRGRLQEISRIRDKYYCEEQALEPGKQYHGRVWLFLRTANATAASANSVKD